MRATVEKIMENHGTDMTIVSNGKKKTVRGFFRAVNSKSWQSMESEATMLGEITPVMAAAVGQSEAVKILIPFRSCDNVIVGVKDLSTAALIQEAVREIIAALQ